MIRKCGRDSKIPAMMAVDALSAGVDTTANTGRSPGCPPRFPFPLYFLCLRIITCSASFGCVLFSTLCSVHTRMFDYFPYIICLPTFVSVFILLYTFVCLFSPTSLLYLFPPTSYVSLLHFFAHSSNFSQLHMSAYFSPIHFFAYFSLLRIVCLIFPT